MQPVISQHRDQIAEICRTHHVRRLSAFGSAVRDDFNRQSSEVDVVTDSAVRNPYLRQPIQAEKVALYAA